MRFWHGISAVICAAMLLIVAAAKPPQQAAGRESGSKLPHSKESSDAKERRANELTLAGLRPGKDEASKVRRLFKYADVLKEYPTHMGWHDGCIDHLLMVQFEPNGRIKTVEVAHADWCDPNCTIQEKELRKWKTGRGLAIYDSRERVTQLYGLPQSISPSTEGGRELELMFYAFDWAGPDVPQVMEVTLEKGRVVKILLAAESL